MTDTDDPDEAAYLRQEQGPVQVFQKGRGAAIWLRDVSGTAFREHH
jgi:hypothetical protein